MRTIFLAMLLTLSLGCDDLVEFVPDAEPLADASPDAAAWPTARDAVRAECSALCRWESRCEGTVLESCEAGCTADACALYDCRLPPSGSEAIIQTCVHSLYVEAVGVVCAETPYTYTEQCAAAVRP